jgi:peptide methionine sulfoxide reductase MsrB
MLCRDQELQIPFNHISLHSPFLLIRTIFRRSQSDRTSNMKAFLVLLCPMVSLAFSCAPTRKLDRPRMSLEMATSRRSFLGSGLVTAIAFTAPIAPSTVSAAGLAADDKLAVGGQIAFGDEAIMAPKAHGTSQFPVQSDLMYGVSNKLADRICNFNRHFAESAGYFQSTNWEEAVLQSNGQPITFYDSVTGKPLFVAPIGRSAADLIAESEKHGWPSFRDQEVVWENVRVLRSSGETVSKDGTHLGHNLPDRKGNRYCINLVSIAGKPRQVVQVAAL